MVLKATGGRIYLYASIGSTTPLANANIEPVRIGDLTFQVGSADVTNVVVGRIPVADLGAYYSGAEASSVEPFRNPDNGNFRGLVSRLSTDAVLVQFTRPHNNSDVALHSLKHALLNSAPAVTGLTQEEFGADIREDTGQLVIYDAVHGGTGGCRLLAERRLVRWLDVARELAECHQVQCDAACRACLFLPTRICRQNNHNLDRTLVLELLRGRLN